MTDDTWERATTLDELATRKAVVFKRGQHQLALIYTESSDGSPACHAIDNRCPHEGYPLSQGSVDERCVLTCNWHNWKFELASGKNLLGGDDVRVYPTQIREGEGGAQIWVDLADPPQSEVVAKVLAGLRAAFDDQDHGWIARELARLVAAGVDPAQVAIPAALN